MAPTDSATQHIPHSTSDSPRGPTLCQPLCVSHSVSAPLCQPASNGPTLCQPHSVSATLCQPASNGPALCQPHSVSASIKRPHSVSAPLCVSPPLCQPLCVSPTLCQPASIGNAHLEETTGPWACCHGSRQRRTGGQQGRRLTPAPPLPPPSLSQALAVPLLGFHPLLSLPLPPLVLQPQGVQPAMLLRSRPPMALAGVDAVLQMPLPGGGGRQVGSSGGGRAHDCLGPRGTRDLGLPPPRSRLHCLHALSRQMRAGPAQRCRGGGGWQRALCKRKEQGRALAMQGEWEKGAKCACVHMICNSCAVGAPSQRTYPERVPKPVALIKHAFPVKAIECKLWRGVLASAVGPPELLVTHDLLQPPVRHTGVSTLLRIVGLQKEKCQKYARTTQHVASDLYTATDLKVRHSPISCLFLCARAGVCLVAFFKLPSLRCALLWVGRICKLTPL